MTAAVGTRVTQTQALAAFHLTSAYERVTQGNVLTAIRYPSKGERITQGNILVADKTLPIVRNTETNILVAILTGAEERLLRAWTFTQDDHDFYVLQAGKYTYVYDNLTSQWSQWQSPDAQYYFKGADGTAWNGINVCCDPDNGTVYQIDPVGRLDYNTTPITSVIYGGMTERFRDHVPAYMLEVAISQASPAQAGGTVNITLDSYDTINWYNHGSLLGSLVGTPTWVRFYGLGVIGAPGRLFRITDTGVARRIDGIQLEIGGTGA